MSNITLIEGNKKDKKDKHHLFVVHFDDGNTAKFVGDYLGHSSEYQPMMVILLEEDSDQIPIAVIHADKIKMVEMKEVGDDNINNYV